MSAAFATPLSALLLRFACGRDKSEPRPVLCVPLGRAIAECMHRLFFSNCIIGGDDDDDDGLSVRP